MKYELNHSFFSESTSPRNNVVYAPLQQTFSDDDDFEDEILFDRDPKITATTRNSSSGSSSKRSSSDVIELQNLNGSPLQFHRRRSEVAVRSGWSITQKICIFLSVLGILGAGVGAAIYFPRFLLPPNFVITPEWNVDFSNYGEFDSVCAEFTRARIRVHAKVFIFLSSVLSLSYCNKRFYLELVNIVFI